MPNSRVTPLRIRVWIIEVGILVGVLILVIFWFARELNTEKDRATKQEEAVLIAGCHRINNNATQLIGLVEFAVTDPATGQPTSERGQKFLDYTKDHIHVIDCTEIPDRLNGG